MCLYLIEGHDALSDSEHQPEILVDHVTDRHVTDSTQRSTRFLFLYYAAGGGVPLVTSTSETVRQGLEISTDKRAVSSNEASSLMVGNPEVVLPIVASQALRWTATHGINIGTRHTRDLTDQQWKILAPYSQSRPGGLTAGVVPGRSGGAVLNGILWVLRTGAPWAELPDRYPSYQTCHRRFQQWVRSGVIKGILEALAAELKIHGVIEVEEAFIDGSFAPSKKEGSKIGKTKRGKESNIMAVADLHGLPVAVSVESATPHEVKLATRTLVQMVVPDAPQNLIGDNAYDSDKLDSELRQYGIELIAPQRMNRKNTT